MTIDFLSQHPELAGQLARWHHDEWAALIPGWTREIALAELRSHTGQAVIPTTLVAVENGAALGSVSLLADDLDEWIGKYSPWLASLYVRPDARGRGVGGELVSRAVSVARSAGAGRLYVFAANSEKFYSGKGWSVVERVVHHGVKSAVMTIVPGP